MSGLDALNEQCERRGWRLRLTGTTSGPEQTGLRVGNLEVRGRLLGGARELLAKVKLAGVSGADYDAAALDLAKALDEQGLLT